MAAAADLTEVRAYQDLDEEAAARRARTGTIALLSAQVSGPLELRYIFSAATGVIEAYLLTRLWALTEDQVRADARAATQRLLTPGDHVMTAPLDPAELEHALRPHQPHPAGALDIRKRVLTAKPNRPDAGVAWYVSVEPFTLEPRSWTPVLAHMAASSHDVAVSVGVQAVQVPGLAGACAQVSTSYARLARDGERNQGALYGGKVKLTPDAFALTAEKVFGDAARRYQGQLFNLRVSVSSPMPLDDSLASTVGQALSHANAGSHLEVERAGSAFRLVRPAPSDLRVFADNLAGLGFTSWGRHEAFTSGVAAPAIEPLCTVVDASEAASAFQLPLAVHGHLPGFPVRAADPSMVSDYRATGPALTLGAQPGGQSAAISVTDLNRHALVVGTTGSGKTNTVLGLLRQLWTNHKVPWLVIEPVNSERDDYRWLSTLDGFESMVVLTVGDDSVAPLRLNPFEVPSGVLVSTHASNLRSCFDIAFGLWDPLPAIYAKALRLTYMRAGFEPGHVSTPDDADHWPVLADFVDAITSVTDNLDYAGEVRSNILAASRLRAESLAEGPCASTLSARRSTPIAHLLDRPVVLELARVGDDPKEQSLVTALVLMTLTEHYKASRTSSELTHVTLIEEAHRLLGKPPAADTKEGNAAAQAASAFANTLAENRKYGEGLIIVEQDPSKLITDAYKNTNLKVMHQLPAQEDRTLVGATMRMAPDQVAHAGAITKMRAYAFHSYMDRPALVDVPDVRALDARQRGLLEAPLSTDTELRAAFERFKELPGVSESLESAGECGVCPHRCQLRDVARGVSGEHSKAFASALTGYASTPHLDAWWDMMVSLLRAAGAPRAPRRITNEPHWLTAVLLELHSESFSGPAHAWVKLLKAQLS